MMQVVPQNPDALLRAETKAERAKSKWRWSLAANTAAAIALLFLTGFLAAPFIVWWYWKHFTVDREKTRPA